MQAANESRLSVPEAPSGDSEAYDTKKRSLAKRPNNNSSLLARALSFMTVGALLSVAIWVVTLAQTEFQSDFTASPSRFLVQRWGEGKAAPRGRSQWETAVYELRRASDIQPDDPSLHQTLGNALMVGTFQPWASPVERVLWIGQAQFHYKEATNLQPREAFTWALLASAMARAGLFGAEMDQAAQNALVYGPNEAHVHQTLLPIVLQHWDKVSPALQQWARLLSERGDASQRAAINRLGERFGRQIKSEP